MNKTFWMLGGCVVLGVAGVGWALSSSTSFKPLTLRGVAPDTPHEEVVRLNRERNRPSPRLLSRAVVEETRHDFGMMDPNTKKAHTFTIRNEGQEPLHLGNPRTTCKCGTGSFQDRVIEPGEETQFTVGWEPGPEERQLDITFIVPTSDPDMREIRFYITGNVRQRLAAEPSPVVFSSLKPGTSESRETLVYSSVWKDFSLEDVESDFDGLTWDVLPAPPDVLREKRAHCGHVIKVHTPENLPRGFFERSLTFRAVPANPDFESALYSIPIQGKARGRLGIYGEGIDETGTIHMGVVHRGEGAKKRFVVKVRDEQDELKVRQIETQPSFIDVRLTRNPAAAGLYLLDVEVPPDAPTCTHLLDEEGLGEITLQYDHPRISRTQLKLRFAVARRIAVPVLP